MNRADLLVGIIAIVIGLWCLAGALTLHPIFLRWNLARWAKDTHGDWVARFIYLAAFGLLALCAYFVFTGKRIISGERFHPTAPSKFNRPPHMLASLAVMIDRN